MTMAFIIAVSVEILMMDRVGNAIFHAQNEFFP
jgi:hypothetical protein